MLSLIKCSILFLSVTHDIGSSSNALQTSNHLHIRVSIVSLTVVRQVSFHNSVNNVAEHLCSMASAEMAEYVQRVGEQPSEL